MLEVQKQLAYACVRFPKRFKALLEPNLNGLSRLSDPVMLVSELRRWLALTTLAHAVAYRHQVRPALTDHTRSGTVLVHHGLWLPCRYPATGLCSSGILSFSRTFGASCRSSVLVSTISGFS